MGAFTKKVEDLQIYDNYVFCKVMRNKAICKEMLEILLNIQIDDIQYIETESEIQDFYEHKGIRLDVYVKDSDRVFNMEMQTANYSDLFLRARYYQGATDLSNTPRRTKYRELKESYIIFICRSDPFNLGLPVYTECKTFLEKPDYLINDKTHKIFYNASDYNKVKDDEELQAVLKFIHTLKADSEFTKKLEKEVQETKQKPAFKDDYMYFEDILEEEREIAREEGLAEGRTKGLAEGLENGTLKILLEQIKKKLDKNKSIEQIADEIEETPEYVAELIKTRIN